MKKVLELLFSSLFLILSFLGNICYFLFEKIESQIVYFIYLIILVISPLSIIIFLYRINSNSYQINRRRKFARIILISILFEFRIAHLIPFIWKDLDLDSDEDFEFTVLVQKKILFVMEGFYVPLEIIPIAILQMINNSEKDITYFTFFCLFISFINVAKLIRNLGKKLFRFANPHSEDDNYDILVDMGSLEIHQKFLK